MRLRSWGVAGAILILAGCGQSNGDIEVAARSSQPSSASHAAVPPEAARCPLFDRDDNYRQETLSEHRAELERGASEAPEEIATAEVAFVQPTAWDELPEAVDRSDVKGFTLAYHPFIAGTTIYASIVREEGEPLDQAQQRIAESLIFDLRSDREEASRSERQRIDSIVARVESGERPAIAVLLAAPLGELSELRDHDAVYDIALDDEALEPLDKSSIDNRRTACADAAREGSETKGKPGQ